ncbi:MULTISPECIES: AAA family ATPase [Rhizobiaceae]|uniref:AAA family ATPase n=1 Tax=Rhizobiaceae TaxID=82115 RepID=UPI001F28DFE6|nr:AAA family ATPase [Sinorhizobium meliloti]
MRPTQPERLQRVLIFGNAGTGKTWLAREIGAIIGRSVVHLDDLRWHPGQYGVARDNQLVFDEVVEAGRAETWLMEGVYGWLVSAVLARVTTLVWIDLPEEECIANVRARGIQGGGSEENFHELIEWVRAYRKRENSSTCYSGHARLFEAHAGSKVILRNRAEISAYIESIRAVTP